MPLKVKENSPLSPPVMRLLRACDYNRAAGIHKSWFQPTRGMLLRCVCCHRIQRFNPPKNGLLNKNICVCVVRDRGGGNHEVRGKKEAQLKTKNEKAAGAGFKLPCSASSSARRGAMWIVIGKTSISVSSSSEKLQRSGAHGS